MRIGSATDGSWMPAPPERSVCSARVQPSTTGSTASRWLGFGASVIVDLAGRGLAGPGRGEVVLDVARAALVVDDDRVDRPLALELAQDRLVRAADRVHEHVQAAAVRHPDHDLVRAGVRGELDRLVEHRHHRVEALERELLLAEERAAQVLLEALGPRERARAGGSAPRARAAAGSGSTRSPAAARRAPRGRRGARSRRPSCRCRPRGGSAAPPSASRPGRGRGAAYAGMRSCSSGVSGGISRVSSSAGSPSGSEPSGSSRAARWPCMRCALTSAIAAATAPSSVSSIRPAAGGSGAAGGGRRRGRCGDLGGRPLAPLSRSSVSSRRSRPGWEATSSLSPLSNSSRHSGGTASGFSR